MGKEDKNTMKKTILMLLMSLVSVALAAPVRAKVWNSRRTLSWTCLSGSNTTPAPARWTKPTGSGQRNSPRRALLRMPRANEP